MSSNATNAAARGRSSSGSYLLPLWTRQDSAAATTTEEEELPTELNATVDGSAESFLVVSPDKLSVKYAAESYHSYDVGAVQANRPAPASRLAPYYFEMRVRNAGSKRRVAIGFTKEDFDLCMQPGWRANSCGYHGDNGFVYRGGGKGESFGPSFTTNDIVGAGINYASNEFFFTKNGTMVGAVSKDIEGPLFPTVAVHGLNEEIEVNFGQKPFAFNIKARHLSLLPPCASFGVWLPLYNIKRKLVILKNYFSLIKLHSC
ncbi:unnamed protein product [Linum tenue]|uniref:B30.2/SPRY domain-containing protein n=2 Tax=Linum tenue TaxID=586396 RepID=A0AAV0LL43_9ROSI|nr:unnamed protein product [Linum tenue]